MRSGIFSIVIALSVVVCAADFVEELDSKIVRKVKVECAEPGNWKIQTNLKDVGVDGLEELELSMMTDSFAAPPKLSVSFSVPQHDIHYAWHTGAESLRLHPKWHGGFVSSLANGMPLMTLLGSDDSSRLTFAASESVLPVRCRAGLKEEDCTIPCSVVFFERPAAPMKSYSVVIRFNGMRQRWDETIKETTAWMERKGGYVPMGVPEAAKDPLYSTWYAFTQNVTASKIEDEARRAAKLGMKTLILDDGWQTDETGRAYERCGDMTVSAAKFPDGMAAHVKRVQTCGIKYMIWCAVPFVGYKNAVHERFRGTYLREQESVHCSVLDPRFPEVREYLAGMFEQMLKEWGVDGFKFDYVGQLALLSEEKDPAIADNYAGRDTKSVPDAVDMLMTDVLKRLRKLKSDVLIEYRQPYLGPAIRRYGTMIRAIDCPGEMQKNIVRTAMLRLTSGKTAVHSDMLEWNVGDSPERAAQSILSSLFSTIQYSMVLSKLRDDHLRMMRHWIGFTQQYRKTLLDGDFTARYPQAHYPILEAASEESRIIAVYLSGQVARVKLDCPTVVVNATGTTSMVIDCKAPASAVVRDTFGVKVGEMRLKEGLSQVELPISGYLELKRDERKLIDCNLQ